MSLNSEYNLFLDDARNPSDVTWIKLPSVPWYIVRNYKEFVETIEDRGIPKIISFDHDLCSEHYKEYFEARNSLIIGGPKIRYDLFSEKTGYDAAKWLANFCVDNKHEIPQYYLHTLNPIGRMNMFHILENARIHINNES